VPLPSLTLLRARSQFASAISYTYFDLRDRETSGRWRYIDIHMWLPFAACGFDVALAAHVFHESLFNNVLNMVMAFLISWIAMKQYRRATERSTVEERRNHVYEVAFPRLISTVPPLTIFAAEVCACWLHSYFECEEVGEPMRLGEHSQCDGKWGGGGGGEVFYGPQIIRTRPLIRWPAFYRHN
jgi:hypothetical protein